MSAWAAVSSQWRGTEDREQGQNPSPARLYRSSGSPKRSSVVGQRRALDGSGVRKDAAGTGGRSKCYVAGFVEAPQYPRLRNRRGKIMLAFPYANGWREALLTPAAA